MSDRMANGENGSGPVDSMAAFYEASRRLIGKSIVERAHWNNEVSADAIRHFAWGISDDNPMWVDPGYASKGPHGRLAAPPTFLFSVLYPFLHGAAPSFPITFLISDIDARWFFPILEGDRIQAIAVTKEVIEVPDREGRNTVHIISEVTYRNHDSEVVGVIEGTLAAVERNESEMMLERNISGYSEEDVKAIETAILSETRTGGDLLPHLGVKPGDELPPIVRGPMSLGDLINWQVAIGPSYRAGTLGYKDLLQKPHTGTVIPGVGWPVRYSQQHEDFNLTKQRGMPAPFDNSSMRVAWLSVLLTNWIGDHGFLRHLRVSTVRPVLYGDTNWYTGKVTRTIQSEEELLVSIRLTGTNQLGEISTTGEAEVSLPRKRSYHSEGVGLSITEAEIKWGTRESELKERTVCDLFAKQAKTSPDSVAVTCSGEFLSYGQLDSLSGRLANKLIDMGLKSGDRLGLYLNRSLNTTVAIIACAKAGVAYVPLDQGYPSDQIFQMVEEADLAVVLTDTNAIDSVSSEKVNQISLPNMMEQPASSWDEKEPTVSSEALAYVLFTSGSTGRKKAVGVDHKSLSVYIQSLTESLDVSSSDTYLHTASLSFSASVRQFWMPLCVGARLVMVDDETRRDPVELLQAIQRENATVWDTVPSVLSYTIGSLEQLSENKHFELLKHIPRRVFTTGEALQWETVYAWKRLTGKSGTIVNLYSQTETAGTVCSYPVADDEFDRQGIVPLGTPVAHTGLCLLDVTLTPLGSGGVGEICVVGERFGTKYIGDTQADGRFTELADRSGRKFRVSRTGDLGRLNEAGLLEFVGRVDDQVKIRGLRVQLGEIESALKRDSSVSECAVLAVAEDEEEAAASLIAYVVPEEGCALNLEELKGKVARWLPGFMLPRSIVPLQSLPRTPNGKLDRLALPQPEKTDDAPVADNPSTVTEKWLVGIWKEVLHVDNIGIDDNFFELGGHSLSATRVANRMKERVGTQISLIQIFELPTISELAAHIDSLH